MQREKRSIAPAAIAALVATLAPTLPLEPAHAAEDCLAAPNSNAPQGSHWYYRTDRVAKKKCWYVSQSGVARAAVAPDGYAPTAAPDAGNPTRDTVGRGHPAQQADAAPAAGPSVGATASRDCEIAQSVLNYRKILATVFQSQSTSSEVDAQTKELAAKRCRGSQ